MNFKTIVAIIGIIFSITHLISADNGRHCVEETVCDSDGNIYSNSCTLEDAISQTKELRQALCYGS